MRVRIILQIAPRDRDGERLPAAVLHQEAERIMEELFAIEEAEGSITNVATAGDDDGVLTAEAILEVGDEESPVDRFIAIFDTAAVWPVDRLPRPAGWPFRYETSDPDRRRVALEVLPPRPPGPPAE